MRRDNRSGWNISSEEVFRLCFLRMEALMNNKIFAAHAAASAASVALGTAATYPLDTLKVLIQV